MADNEKVGTALALAREFSESLGTAADTLNAELGEAEEKLQALKLGIEASVLMGTNDDVQRYLAFKKHGLVWSLVVEGIPLGLTEVEFEVELVHASRDARVEAVAYLPELLDRLVTTAEAELRRVRGATTVLREFNASLSGATGKR